MKKVRAFEIRNMHTGIHELWILKNNVRVKTVINLINWFHNVEPEFYSMACNMVSNKLNELIKDSIEVNFRDKENNTYYNKYIVVNECMDVYGV